MRDHFGDDIIIFSGNVGDRTCDGFVNQADMEDFMHHVIGGAGGAGSFYDTISLDPSTATYIGTSVNQETGSYITITMDVFTGDATWSGDW